MNVLIPLTFRVHLALRARLAAFLVLALLFTGTFNMRAANVQAGRPLSPVDAAYGLVVQPAHVTTAHAPTQIGKFSRLRQLGRRGARYEEVHHSVGAIAWPDLDSSAPTRPRFFFRKIPTDEGSDADADADPLPADAYHSRAPPAIA